MKKQKQYFLKRVSVSSVQDALRNSLVASFQRNLTYKNGVKYYERKSLGKAVREKLLNMEPLYASPVSDELHIKNIVHISRLLTKQFRGILVGGRFRIGTAQKALNLFVKFLWCLNDNYPTPPHCPLDSRVLKLVSVYEPWTNLDSIKVYKQWIKRVQNHSLMFNFETIAEWELNAWNKSG